MFFLHANQHLDLLCFLFPLSTVPLFPGLLRRNGRLDLVRHSGFDDEDAEPAEEEEGLFVPERRRQCSLHQVGGGGER